MDTKKPRHPILFRGNYAKAGGAVRLVIKGLGSYVPQKVMTNDDWAQIVDTSDEWITTKMGISERRIADEDDCTSDLAVKAATPAFREAGVEP